MSEVSAVSCHQYNMSEVSGCQLCESISMIEVSAVSGHQYNALKGAVCSYVIAVIKGSTVTRRPSGRCDARGNVETDVSFFSFSLFQFSFFLFFFRQTWLRL